MKNFKEERTNKILQTFKETFLKFYNIDPPIYNSCKSVFSPIKIFFPKFIYY